VRGDGRCGARTVAALLAAFMALGGLLWGGAGEAGEPITVGGTLALGGPLAPTAFIHRMAGEVFIERQNARGGWLGRPIRWTLLDDQSKPDQARALYERLIAVDKVDLLIGPYATGNIQAAMEVAARHNKVFVHHTFGIPRLATYKWQFPAWHIGQEPEHTFPATLYAALKSAGAPPKTVAIVTSKFPSTQFMAIGARDEAPKYGLRVVLYLEYDFGAGDLAPVAARLREANADFVFVGAIGLDANMLLDAMQKINYKAPGIFFLYPAPGPLLGLGKVSAYAMAVTVFEEHPPFTDDPDTADLVRRFHARADAVGLRYRDVETQAAASYTAWQILGAAVAGARTFDQEKLAEWLLRNKVKTVQGVVRFDGKNNYGDDLNRVKQIRDGQWAVVWPPEFAKPGRKLVYPAP
jgi:branched-chain amino acid transport system substrate-binding protein